MASILLFAALCFLTADVSRSPLATTTASNCSDATFVNCSDSHVCSDANLRKYCPVTCGVCSTKISNACYDDHVFNCSKNVCGFPSLKKFCPVTCGVCGYGAGSGPGGTGMVNSGNCTDLLSNCKEYSQSVCHEPFVGWAEHNCPKFCDFCVGSAISAGSKTNSSIGSVTVTIGSAGSKTNPSVGSVTVTIVNCKDRISNCIEYGRYACLDPYADWAKQNCAKTCRFCVGNAGSKPNPSVGSVTVTTVDCKDRLSNCKEHGHYACLAPYDEWAKQNCAKFCRFCVSELNTGISSSTPSMGLGTKANISCHDSNPNCLLYGKSLCSGPYLTWIKSNCPKFCNLCAQLAP